MAYLYDFVRQEPAPGTLLREWDSVGIEVVKHGDAPDNESAEPMPLPAGELAHAAPEVEQYVDLADD